MDNKIRLLIVDDEVEFVETIAERLEQRDFVVSMAHGGDEALAIAKREKFDLALVDIKMPGMDGKQLLDSLKKEHKFLEVIMLTGFGSVDSAFECSKLGAFSYQTKPFDLENLLLILKDAFTARMENKFKHDEERAQRLADIARGSSPLGILRAMKDLDDEQM